MCYCWTFRPPKHSGATHWAPTLHRWKLCFTHFRCSAQFTDGNCGRKWPREIHRYRRNVKRLWTKQSSIQELCYQKHRSWKWEIKIFLNDYILLWQGHSTLSYITLWTFPEKHSRDVFATWIRIVIRASRPWPCQNNFTNISCCCSLLIELNNIRGFKINLKVPHWLSVRKLLRNGQPIF